MKKYQRGNIGETYTSNEGYSLEIVDRGSKPEYCTVRIDNKYEIESQYRAVKNGKVRNLYHKSVYGHGYVGVGNHKAWINGRHTKAYNLWSSMIARVYYMEYKEGKPTYDNVKVCEDWHNFQEFSDWFYSEPNNSKGFQLDKDILGGDEKIYSPETCCLVPQEINSFMANKYLNNKSGFTGVHISPNKKRWIASINVNKKKKTLGTFDTPEEASAVYQEAREIEAQKLRGKYRGVIEDYILDKIK